MPSPDLAAIEAEINEFPRHYLDSHPDFKPWDEIDHNLTPGACLLLNAAPALTREIRRLEAELAKHAKADLLRLMRDLSDTCWCAGWMDGTEYALWEVWSAKDRQWGMMILDDESCNELKRLSDLCRGWWVWSDEEKGNKFLTLDEWALLRKAVKP